MNLFTATAILVTLSKVDKITTNESILIDITVATYIDWLITQKESYLTGKNTIRSNGVNGVSWLLDIPTMYSRRAPGITCLSSLGNLKHHKCYQDFLEFPTNNSKGCGGIMRSAPIGLISPHLYDELINLDLIAAKMSAITHGHSLGYMPSAMLVHILNRIVYPKSTCDTLKDIVIEAKNTIAKLFKNDIYIKELCDIVDLSIFLSENNNEDLDNIRMIGEGWVAEETLAISLYCSLKYQNNFTKGIVASVNHSGDSDSTGAVTGYILGAWLGFENIELKWLKNLELIDVITEISNDISAISCNNESDLRDKAYWKEKYLYFHQYKDKK
jgi:ADP-ribosylglycohydrolase